MWPVLQRSLWAGEDPLTSAAPAGAGGGKAWAARAGDGCWSIGGRLDSREGWAVPDVVWRAAGEVGWLGGWTWGSAGN